MNNSRNLANFLGKNKTTTNCLLRVPMKKFHNESFINRQKTSESELRDLSACLSNGEEHPAVTLEQVRRRSTAISAASRRHRQELSSFLLNFC